MHGSLPISTIRPRYGQVITLQYANGRIVELALPDVIRVVVAGRCPHVGTMRAFVPLRDCLVEVARAHFDELVELFARTSVCT